MDGCELRAVLRVDFFPVNELTPVMNGELIKKIFKQIEGKIDEGERLLADVKLRTQIEFSLEAACFKVEDKQLSPRKLMIELTSAVIQALTQSPHLTNLDGIVALLKPLKEIKDIVSADKFNEVVAVRIQKHKTDPWTLQTSDSPPPLPLKKFLNDLRDYLNRDKGAENKPTSRRIEGFAPRPRDDEGHEPKG